MRVAAALALTLAQAGAPKPAAAPAVSPAPAVTPAPGASFDPHEYIKKLPDDAGDTLPDGDTSGDSVRQGRVYIGGKPFMAFQSPAGTIYLPVVRDLTPADLEAALCAGQADVPACEPARPESRACRDNAAAEAGVARFEMPLGGTYVAYTDAILLTIERKCGAANGPRTFKLAVPALEAGVAKKNDGRDPGESKVFVRPASPKSWPNGAPSREVAPEAGAGITF